MPEFSLYLPGRGGNLRLGLRAGGQTRWLHETRHIVARYHAGMMLYDIRDPLLGRGELRLAVLVTRAQEGIILRAECSGTTGVEMIFAFGGWMAGVAGATATSAAKSSRWQSCFSCGPSSAPPIPSPVLPGRTS